MTDWLLKFKTSFRDRNFLLSVSIAVLFLFLSLVINFYAGMYATEKASSSVTDIILSNIRVYDVDGMFIYGSVIFWICTGLVCFWEPRSLPFTIKSIALFVVIRSVFISLTHIGPFPTQAIIDSTSIVSRFSFGADLFFSGHTGLPFLLSLVFWQQKYLRYFFLISSFVFAAVVLMGHIHYSIDVLSAFFITFSIFHISQFLFKKDQQNFLR